jgi:hypothetical protein
MLTRDNGEVEYESEEMPLVVIVMRRLYILLRGRPW